MAADKVTGFARKRIGEVRSFLHRLTVADDRVVGIVVRLLVAHVSGPNHATIRRNPSALPAVGQRDFPQPSRHALPRRRYEIMSFMQKAEELIKATPLRMEGGSTAKMPLANQASGIAHAPQPVGERALGHR